MNNIHGKLFVIAGPSGAGIGEIIDATIKNRDDVGFVIPVTARKMRPGEENGKGFWFYDLDGWDELIKTGDLLEHTVFAGNDYGTSRKNVEEQLTQGKIVILELEMDRAEQLKKNMPEAVVIFMVPSDKEVLENRYKEKARSSFEVAIRMEEAKKQIEMSKSADYMVYTDDINKAIEDLETIITSEKCKADVAKEQLKDF